MAALGYPGAKIYLKKDVPTVFPVVEVMLISSIHRTQSPKEVNEATSTSLGSKASGPCKRTARHCQHDLLVSDITIKTTL